MNTFINVRQLRLLRFVTFSLIAVALLCLSAIASAQPVEEPVDPDLLTVAEASEYEETATYDQVIELLDRIEAQSDIMRRVVMGTTVEGRDIPVAILANPPIDSAEQARDSGKVIIFTFANIHAGEVCGKEATLMLIRELALNPDHPLLERLVLVFAPIYNADGNEYFSPDNRPGQVGPREMGQRENAQGFDLNRDFVKLEAPETRALVTFFNNWQPHITIDCHTTNGSRHAYTLTYDTPLNPNTPPGIIEYLRDELLPTVTDRLRETTGYETFYYGNFNNDRTIWAAYSPLARYGANYQGLRGEAQILSEAYAYAPFKDRVLCTREFLRQIYQVAAADRRRVLQMQRVAQQQIETAGRELEPDDVVGIRYDFAAFKQPVTVLAEEPGADEPSALQVLHLGRFESIRSVRRPFGYLIPPGHDNVLENLQQHGIEIEPFEGGAVVERYLIRSIERRRRPFQGHRLATIEASAQIERETLPEGTSLIRTSQPLGTLAVYLLEPESQDGLAAWNFFDEAIANDNRFPVMRVRTEDDLTPE